MEKLEPEEVVEELVIEGKEDVQQEVTKGEHLIEREETTKNVTTTGTFNSCLAWFSGIQ